MTILISFSFSISGKKVKELGNGMRGMLGTRGIRERRRGIRVGTWGIRVGTRGIKVGTRGIMVGMPLRLSVKAGMGNWGTE